ncbi:MAG: leucine-rich repeat domain-containing protein [Clostridia bacterium]|nr:leucine-rich repeat domain-containing protein [Clostridia bacterium]
MRKSKKNGAVQTTVEDEILNIPEDEIWTYKIDGLQAPRIVDKTVKPQVKAGIIAVLLVAISLSVFFSIRAVSNEEYKYSKAENGYEFVKYTNPGNVTEVSVDYIDGDKAKPVTEIHEYAFNCDEKIVTVNIGRDVEKIDGKSFYSCWNLEAVFVDDENPYFRDIDGVLYDRELTRVIYYPSAHNLYLTRQAGYKLTFPENGSITGDDFCSAVKLISDCFAQNKNPKELTGDDAALIDKFVKVSGVTDFEQFNRDYESKAGIYVLPSTVTEIGKLAFAYSDITEIYLPEGLKEIGTLGFFKAEKLKKIFSYTAKEKITDTVYGNVADKLSAYPSLPNGLEKIGSDAFTYDRGITYLFIPSSVKEIGHHAFFNMAFKSGDTVEGLSQVNVEADEAAFDENTKIGESWLPKLEAGLLKKNVEVIYSSARNG